MKKLHYSTKEIAQLALLTAIILILAFTPLGYIRTPGLEITLIVVPVTIGAILLGPSGGAFLGCVFGITSFIQCFGMSPFGATLLSINAISTFIVCVIPRLLMGLIGGYAYQLISKTPAKSFANVVTNVICPLLNTVFFMSALVFFFYNTEYIQSMVGAFGATNPLHFVLIFVGVNGVVEAVICIVVGSLLTKALSRFVKA